MKTKLIILVVAIFGASCEKKDGAVIKGKLIYRSCATTVVQVLDPEYFYLTQAEWKQSDTRPTYEHVFNVSNVCSFPAFPEGQEFTFKVIDKDDNGCAVCMMYDNPPAKQQMIRVVDKLK